MGSNSTDHGDGSSIMHTHAVPFDAQVRLDGGRADRAGAWEYGRLELAVDGFWSPIVDINQFRDTRFDQAGAQVSLLLPTKQHFRMNLTVQPCHLPKPEATYVLGSFPGHASDGES